MAIKMRFLYYSGKGKMKKIGEAVKTAFDLQENHNAVDIIPPAYAPDKERLVVLAISGKGEPDDVLRRFIRELDKQNAANVCLLIDGDRKMADSVLSLLAPGGTNVIGEPLFIKISLFGNVDETAKNVVEWLKSAVEQMK